ncbi:enoyl-CoA hydratase/isomerase family protein [Streptomyces mirabilis]|uniref:enoyl-CoA hydratase/isomerase family protein n=1 Tax=Streptomyces mirabilis TaxID=68239 RepID=UPI0033B034A6
MTSKPAVGLPLDGVHLDLMESGRPTAPLHVVPLDGMDWDVVRAASATPPAHTGMPGPAPVLVGFATRPLPPQAAPFVEQLTVTLGGELAPFCAGDATHLDSVRATVAAAPSATLTLDAVLRTAARSTLADGLLVESLAYSMLLGAPEFTTWRSRVPHREVTAGVEPVLLERDGGVLRITLNRPRRHNAFGHAVRDGLLDALELAYADTSVTEVVVSGAGPSFCSGGDLDEFGTTPDVATAHLLRLNRSAGRAVAALGDRVRFEVHGACIGAGIEVPSFAPRVTARSGAYFQLPELAMGLIPGAGGTVGLTRRIGRWRTAYLALTGRTIDVATALEWGLVDARA